MRKTTPSTNSLLTFSLSDNSHCAEIKRQIQQLPNGHIFLHASVQTQNCALPDNAVTAIGLSTSQLTERLYAVVAEANVGRPIPIRITSAVAVDYNASRSFGITKPITPSEDIPFDKAVLTE